MEGVGPVGGSQFGEVGGSSSGGSFASGSLGAICDEIASHAQALPTNADQVNYLKGALCFLRYAANQYYPPGQQFPALFDMVSSGNTNAAGAIAGLKDIESSTTTMPGTRTLASHENMFQYITGGSGAGSILQNVGDLMTTNDGTYASGYVNVTDSNQMQGLLDAARAVMGGASNAIPKTNQFLFDVCNSIINQLVVPSTGATVNFMRTIDRCIPTIQPNKPHDTATLLKEIWTQLPQALSYGLDDIYCDSSKEFDMFMIQLEGFLSAVVPSSVISSGGSQSLTTENLSMLETVLPSLEALQKDADANNGKPANLQSDLHQIGNQVEKGLNQYFTS